MFRTTGIPTHPRGPGRLDQLDTALHEHRLARRPCRLVRIPHTRRLSGQPSIDVSPKAGHRESGTVPTRAPGALPSLGTRFVTSTRHRPSIGEYKYLTTLRVVEIRFINNDGLW